MNYFDRDVTDPTDTAINDEIEGHEIPLDYRALADDIGVEYLDDISEANLLVTEAEALRLLRKPNPIVRAQLPGNGGWNTMVLGPTTLGVGPLMQLSERDPQTRSRFRLTSSRALRAALMERAAPALTNFAVSGLLESHRTFSARTRFSTGQALLLGVLLVAMAEMLFLWPSLLICIVSIIGAVFFIAVSMLRVVAAISQAQPPHIDFNNEQDEFPIYTVLVALYREAEVVPQLMGALAKLSWPRDRLEIKLICEADDSATIDAIRTDPRRDLIEIVIAAPSQPMTKPKALRYALPVSMGEFVVLYDAEDRPHPMQLREAYARFRTSADRLACLQAPLEISNEDASWISRMFAFEYAGLFRTLLPWLAQKRVVMPLGGTSNHFRRAALDVVGAWDPNNVTEDADLGIRLRRFGYLCGVLSLPTLEDAPETASVWLAQRTRWCKGWLQTWLVHMRKPWQLAREVGPLSFVLSQILLLGIVLSTLIHPLLIVTIFWTIITVAAGHEPNTLQFAVDSLSIVLGYLGFWWIGLANSTKSVSRGFWRVMVATPIYWLMMSLAAWRGTYQLWQRPFHWNKTPHQPTQTLPVKPARARVNPLGFLSPTQ